MRKNKLIIIMLLAVSFIAKLAFTQNCFAAYAYMWTVDGEQIGLGSSNTAGTASWQKDSEANNGGILTLNNYNGGQIKIECYGTGLGHTFTINLVGDNYITVDKGIGILALEPITFSGNGTLTIEAAVPISSNDYIFEDSIGTKIEGNYSFSENEKVIIRTSDTTTNSNNDNGESIANTDSEDDQLSDENAESIDSDINTTNDENTIDWKLIAIIMIPVTAISIIIIIVLLILLAKKGKIQTTNNSKNISDIDTNLS